MNDIYKIYIYERYLGCPTKKIFYIEKYYSNILLSDIILVKYRVGNIN